MTSDSMQLVVLRLATAEVIEDPAALVLAKPGLIPSVITSKRRAHYGILLFRFSCTRAFTTFASSAFGSGLSYGRRIVLFAFADTQGASASPRSRRNAAVTGYTPRCSACAAK